MATIKEQRDQIERETSAGLPRSPITGGADYASRRTPEATLAHEKIAADAMVASQAAHDLADGAGAAEAHLRAAAMQRAAARSAGMLGRTAEIRETLVLAIEHETLARLGATRAAGTPTTGRRL